MQPSVSKCPRRKAQTTASGERRIMSGAVLRPEAPQPVAIPKVCLNSRASTALWTVELKWLRLGRRTAVTPKLAYIVCSKKSSSSTSCEVRLIRPASTNPSPITWPSTSARSGPSVSGRRARSSGVSKAQGQSGSALIAVHSSAHACNRTAVWVPTDRLGQARRHL